MCVRNFGEYNGTTVKAITLKNGNGMRVELITYGAILKNIIIKDKNGNERDIVIGFDTLEGYLCDTAFMGAIVGRVANRIGYGRFKLNDKEYFLTVNNGNHHLHGGAALSTKIWNYEVARTESLESVKFSTVSPDGECGYPGEVRFEVIYELTADNHLNVITEAFNLSELKTIVNMTNHSYFNLEESENVFDHKLRLKSNAYLPVDHSGLATGEVLPLNDGLRDLVSGVRMGDLEKEGIIDVDNDFIVNCDVAGEDLLRLEGRSGIEMAIWTTNPVIHLYFAQQFNEVRGKKGRLYGKCAAIAIEPQKHSNAINNPSFPSIVLEGHGKYSERIRYAFRCQ